MPSIFTPDNEPYLGRQSVLVFDQQISFAMKINASIAPWTRANTLTPLQRASTEIIPHGFSIGLSIRELIRQGYPVSAEVLLRPLMERSAVLSYLVENPEAVRMWEKGWPYKSRPSLKTMLLAISGAPQNVSATFESIAKDIIDHFNSIIHADPIGARHQRISDSEGNSSYSASKALNSPEWCDDIAKQTLLFFTILIVRAVQIFPEATKTNDN